LGHLNCSGCGIQSNQRMGWPFTSSSTTTKISDGAVSITGVAHDADAWRDIPTRQRSGRHGSSEMRRPHDRTSRSAAQFPVVGSRVPKMHVGTAVRPTLLDKCRPRAGHRRSGSQNRRRCQPANHQRGESRHSNFGPRYLPARKIHVVQRCDRLSGRRPMPSPKMQGPNDSRDIHSPVGRVSM
jgi:hypothetical protein